MRGCECPTPDADGVVYESGWYVGRAVAEDAPADVADVVLTTEADADVTIRHTSLGMFGWLRQLLLGFFAMFGPKKGRDAEAAAGGGGVAGGEPGDSKSQMCAVM